jgi:hypothetical protein
MENISVVPFVQFSRQTRANLTDLLICIFDFLWTALCPSVWRVVGVISCPHGGKISCRNRFLRSPLDLQLPVINKLHSYCSMEKAERFCPTSSECHSRPTFIFTASPRMSQPISILAEHGGGGDLGNRWRHCHVTQWLLNGYSTFSLRHLT